MSYKINKRTSVASWLAKEGLVDLSEWTGRSPYRLPLDIREPDHHWTYCSSVVAAVGDPACDPRSGGIAGNEHLAQYYGVTTEHFRRNIRPESFSFISAEKGYLLT